MRAAAPPTQHQTAARCSLPHQAVLRTARGQLWQQQVSRPVRRSAGWSGPCQAAASGPGHSNGPARHSPVERSGVPSTPANQQGAFGNIEQMIAGNFNNRQPGLRTDWQEVEGNWVLRPPAGLPRAVAHFLGGAFVGAAPQLTYRLFLETLAARGVLVVATPFSTGFDYLRIADEVHYKFERARGALSLEMQGLPVYGVGHSMGCLQHLLLSSRYVSNRQGNVLMSFNNKAATEAIPLFSPFIAPGARAFAPLLAQLAANPLASQLLNASEMLRGLSPPLARQLLPLFDQLAPIYLEVAQGRVEFHPSPAEVHTLLRSYYGVPRNLLLRFIDDQIDETPRLTSILQTSTVATSSTSNALELTVQNLPGDHVRPLRQAFGDLPPDLAQVASQAVTSGDTLLRGLTQMATQAGFPQATEPLSAFQKGLTGFQEVFGSNTGSNDTEQLVDVIADWIGLPPGRFAAPAPGTLPPGTRPRASLQ